MLKLIYSILFISFLLSAQIIDFEFQEKNNQIVVIFRKPHDFIPPSDGITPDQVWKEVYGVKNGKIILIKRVRGKHIPPKWIDEKVIFDEKE